MLTTRCPQCRTAFRVVADQLRVREGLVRCGVCATVFDGRAFLEEPPPAAAPAAAPARPAEPEPEPPGGGAVPVPPPAVLRGRASSSPAHAMPASAPPAPAPVIRARDDGESAVSRDRVLRAEPALASRGDRIVADAPAVLRGRGDRRQEPALRHGDAPDGPAGRHDHAYGDPDVGAHDDDAQGDTPDDIADGLRDDAPHGPIYGDARTRYSSATDSGRAPPEFLDQDRIESRRTWRRVWAWGCVLGLLALALQLVFAYRTAIAIAAPALRPVLAGACQAVGCTVGYARRIERISIVSSSLRPPAGAASQGAGEGRSRLVLTVVLRNRYDKDQHWPALLLDLTDLSDTVVARKAILPEAYLPPGASRPLAAGAEVTLTVPIEVAGLHVNGYQLDKFFP